MDDVEEIEAETIAPAMASVMEMLQPVIEVVAGYKAQLVESGFGPEAADAMAVAVHDAAIGMVFRMLHEAVS